MANGSETWRCQRTSRIYFSLGLGEASSISAAKSRGFIFACDDRAARREAGIADVKLTGTLGILRKAARHKIINPDEGDLSLTKIIETGFYSPVKSLKEIQNRSV